MLETSHLLYNNLYVSCVNYTRAKHACPSSIENRMVVLILQRVSDYSTPLFVSKQNLAPKVLSQKPLGFRITTCTFTRETCACES